MLCQICQKRMANVHFTQVINNSRTEMYLCEHCANEKGQTGLGPLLNISDFLSGYIGFNGNGAETIAEQKPQEARCQVCGMSYEDFRKVGKLGCSNCYSLFGEQLRPVLSRLHGNVAHMGKMPGKESGNLKAGMELDSLKKQLAKAVQAEEYEKAAEIRDRIKLMESGR